MAAECRIYEQKAVWKVTGEAIRPGGLALTERAMALCALPAGARVLDVGCGAGATVEYLIARRRLTAAGADPSAPLLRSGWRRNRKLPLAQAVGERLPVADGSVDALLAECSLSVTMDVELVLRECYRVLRGGGRLVVSDIYARDPQGVPALRRLPLGCCLAGAMSRRELAGKLEDSGFHIVLWEDHSGALRNFAVQLILAHGSMEEFWCQTTSGSADPAQIQQAIALSRPGYFLLIAGKNARR